VAEFEGSGATTTGTLGGTSCGGESDVCGDTGDAVSCRGIVDPPIIRGVELCPGNDPVGVGATVDEVSVNPLFSILSVADVRTLKTGCILTHDSVSTITVLCGSLRCLRPDVGIGSLIKVVIVRTVTQDEAFVVIEERLLVVKLVTGNEEFPKVSVG
jgi:hypothetical protein